MRRAHSVQTSDITYEEIKMVNKNKVNYELIKKIGLSILAVLVVVDLFLIVNIVPGVKEVLVLVVTGKPETFTELYFENHLPLPSKIDYHQENKFNFIIHNLENKDMEYLYEVYLDENGKKQEIDKNFVFIKKNEYKTISEYFTITLPTTRARITVNLVNENQQVYFWMGNK
jgi:hypothetical protein